MTNSSINVDFGQQSKFAHLNYDRWLLISALSLLAMGLLMVASSSMVISEKNYATPFHYLIKQVAYLGIGLISAIILFQVPMRVWEKLGAPLVLASIALLVIVLIPGLGHQVNGSRRWLGVGPLGGQVSEFAKLFIMLYLAGYLVRRNAEVREKLSGFLKPLALLGIIVSLLLAEPDFGASVVIMGTALGMIFLAGGRLRYFILLLTLVFLGMALLAFTSPYRLQRLTSFINPWAHQYGSGYQLTQSLIAFGQGGWFGVGLGESVQKLFYLPEAHTDFLLAVLAEELGLAGISVVLFLFIVLIWRAFCIGYTACKQERFYGGYLAYGFALYFSLQTLINMGVNVGVLPTKGLTLPLMSYGGTSMLVNCMLLGILMRIDHENRIGGLV